MARAARICGFFGARMLAALRGGGIPPLRKEGGGDVPAESGEAAFQLDEKDGGVQDRSRPKKFVNGPWPFFAQGGKPAPIGGSHPPGRFPKQFGAGLPNLNESSQVKSLVFLVLT